jgi:DNA-binding NarL/FixJ family response regulator
MVSRILIVDDHAGFRASARRLAEAAGLEVAGEAADAASGLAAARTLRPDVVLLDVQLPDASGFAVAEALARDGAGPRVILVSSRDRDDLGPLVDTCGAHGFIAKARLTREALTRLLDPA